MVPWNYMGSPFMFNFTPNTTLLLVSIGSLTQNLGDIKPIDKMLSLTFFHGLYTFIIKSQ